MPRKPHIAIASRPLSRARIWKRRRNIIGIAHSASYRWVAGRSPGSPIPPHIAGWRKGSRPVRPFEVLRRRSGRRDARRIRMSMWGGIRGFVSRSTDSAWRWRRGPTQRGSGVGRRPPWASPTSLGSSDHTAPPRSGGASGLSEVEKGLRTRSRAVRPGFQNSF